MHIRDLRALADYYRDVMIHYYTIGDTEKTRNAMQVLQYQHKIESLEKEMHRSLTRMVGTVWENYLIMEPNRRNL
jgi:hypothetical protein